MSIQGVVVSYKTEKGFGFIKSATVERDIFFHISEYRCEGLPTPGVKVAFDLKDDADGRKSAYNISFLEAPEEPHSDERIHRHQRRSHEENQSKQAYSASVSIREGWDTAKRYVGILNLDDRRLQFDGRSWGTGKTINRSLRFITSVETPLFGPYKINGGGPKLFVESTNIFFTGDDLKRLISALRSQI